MPLTKQDNGGPAFPTCESDGDFGWQPVGGISHLDYAAIHAPDMTDTWWDDFKATHTWLEAHVRWRYHYATAMLAEKRRREKED